MKPSPTNTSKVPKWLRIFIPSALIVVWIVAAGLGGPFFGRISEVSDLDLVAFLPESAEATKVNVQAKAFQDSSALPAIVVFESEGDSKFSPAVTAELQSIGQSLKENVADIDGEIAPLIESEDGQAAYLLVPIDSDSNLRQTVNTIKDQVDSQLPASADYKVTGPAGFSADLNEAFSGIDGLLLGVALAVVLVILLIVYRSPILPLLVLMTSIFALAAAILLVWSLANADIVKINGQVQGILFILVIGAATDYSLLYVSRFREELYKHSDKFTATIESLKGSIEPIAASGGTVIAGLLCLLASDLASNQALGPVGAIGIIFAILSALTFLPSLLFVVGRKAFWPRVPQANASARQQHDQQLKKGIWTRVGDFVSAKPRTIWLSLTAILIVMSLGLLGIRADGVSQSELVLGTSEARDGQSILNRHFSDGSGSPAQVIAPYDSLDELATKLEADKGVDTVAVTAINSPSGAMPLGKAEQAIKDSIRQEIGVGTPGLEAIVEQAYPFSDAEPKVIDGQVLMMATLYDAPDSDEARQTIERLRREVSATDGSILVGGLTAIALDTNTASINDRQIILPLVLTAITIILMILLRSILAPILLLLTTVLSFAAALGVSSLLFNHVWGFPGADPAVVLYAFVFLVALGIDYNMFLMTRVREEVLKVGTKKGVIKGLVVTGGVITSAGVVLAATFAALSVIPILFLVQLAFIVAFGVLLDTIIIRSLLVPALIRDLGAVVWWPSKLRRKP